MDNSHRQCESVYLEQQPQLPSTSAEANDMNTILTTEIQNNSASLLFANLTLHDQLGIYILMASKINNY